MIYTERNNEGEITFQKEVEPFDKRGAIVVGSIQHNNEYIINYFQGVNQCPEFYYMSADLHLHRFPKERQDLIIFHNEKSEDEFKERLETAKKAWINFHTAEAKAMGRFTIFKS